MRHDAGAHRKIELPGLIFVPPDRVHALPPTITGFLFSGLIPLRFIHDGPLAGRPGSGMREPLIFRVALPRSSFMLIRVFSQRSEPESMSTWSSCGDVGNEHTSTRKSETQGSFSGR